MSKNIKSLAVHALAMAALSGGLLAASAAEARTNVVIGAHFGGPGYHAGYRYHPHYGYGGGYGGPRISVGFGVGPYWGGYWAPYYYPYPSYRTTVIYRDYDNYRDYDHRQGLLASPYVQQALVADIGESVSWASGGVIGRVVTTRDGWAGEKYCREFVETLTVNESTRETTGTACQAPGGGWQMVANQP